MGNQSGPATWTSARATNCSGGTKAVPIEGPKTRQPEPSLMFKEIDVYAIHKEKNTAATNAPARQPLEEMDDLWVRVMRFPVSVRLIID